MVSESETAVGTTDEEEIRDAENKWVQNYVKYYKKFNAMREKRGNKEVDLTDTYIVVQPL